MKITVLAENTSAADGIGAEHGLSLYIESCGRRFLFDTGCGRLFAENAEKLGVDLAEAEFAVLSHGHYDHGGGLPVFLEKNRTAPVYLSRYAFGNYRNAEGKYIGLPEELASEPRLVFTEGSRVLSEGLSLYDCNECERACAADASGLYAVRDGQTVPDDFRHEQYLLAEEEGKKILLSGCSHKGILNLVEWFRPDVIVGGFHFFKMPVGEELASRAALLEKTGITFWTCHCTGAEQYAFMRPLMSRLSYLSGGMTIWI